MVMVIDDDPDLRMLVSIYLADWGLICVEAPDCASSLPLLERERGRLRAVLLDYFMPGLAPPVCAREVRARVEPIVPIILVSAAVNIAERAAELSLTRFLSKPFEIGDLRAILEA
ncbi:Sensory box histidine kinase/response regulator [Minicystis rosea]|nr:Sensory box histidine kinase/response regulator [Minicystis rosea]